MVSTGPTPSVAGGEGGPSPVAAEGGRRRSRGLKTKTLRRMLKAKGKKTTGKKATLLKRLHMRGGVQLAPDAAPAEQSAEQGKSAADEALAKEPEYADSSSSDGAAAAGRRRRRSRRHSRRREGGRRHKTKKAKELLGF